MYSQEPINFWDEKVQVQFQNSIKNIDTPGNTWQQKYFSRRIVFWAEIIYSSTFLFLVGTKEHLSIHNPQQYNLKLYIKRCKSPNLIRYQNIVLSHKRGMEWKITRVNVEEIRSVSKFNLVSPYITLLEFFSYFLEEPKTSQELQMLSPVAIYDEVYIDFNVSDWNIETIVTSWNCHCHCVMRWALGSPCRMAQNAMVYCIN